MVWDKEAAEKADEHLETLGCVEQEGRTGVRLMETTNTKLRRTIAAIHAQSDDEEWRELGAFMVIDSTVHVHVDYGKRWGQELVHSLQSLRPDLADALRAQKEWRCNIYSDDADIEPFIEKLFEVYVELL